MSEQPTPTRLPVTGPPSEPIEAADLASALSQLVEAIPRRSAIGPHPTLDAAAENARYCLTWWNEQEDAKFAAIGGSR
jgi:hypothetical protein